MGLNTDEPWSEMDDRDLAQAITFASDTAEIVDFLCRDVEEVRERARQLGLRCRDRVNSIEAILMTRQASGGQFEIKVDGLIRTHRDFRETAIEAARLLQQRLPASKVVITDLRDGSVVPFEHR